MEISYKDDGKTAMVDGLRFTRDEATGYYLSSRPIGDSRKRLHVYIWEKHNGKVLAGHHVHHKTMDKSRNEIADLELLTESEHQRLHAAEMSEEAKQRARDNLMNNAIPKAREWHASEEGRKWHRESAKLSWQGRGTTEYVCTNCGKPFASRKSYSETANRFCFNACKSAWRRKSGVDDEQRSCELCGADFTANRYSTAKRCHECRNRKHPKSGA